MPDSPRIALEEGFSCVSLSVLDSAPARDATSQAMEPIARAVSAPRCPGADTPPEISSSIQARLLSDSDLAAKIAQLELWLADHPESSEEASSVSDLLATLHREFVRRCGRFTAEQAKAIEEAHKVKAGVHCMDSVYSCLAAIYSDEFSAEVEQVTLAKGNMIEIMEMVRSRGYAGPSMKVSYPNNWKPDLKTELLAKTSPSEPGWYFFGLSLFMAWHSVVIAVDRTNLTVPKIYWVDQSSGAFVDVTDGLLGKMLAFEPEYGYRYSEIWQLYLPD